MCAHECFVCVVMQRSLWCYLLCHGACVTECGSTLHVGVVGKLRHGVVSVCVGFSPSQGSRVGQCVLVCGVLMLTFTRSVSLYITSSGNPTALWMSCFPLLRSLLPHKQSYTWTHTHARTHTHHTHAPPAPTYSCSTPYIPHVKCHLQGM